MLTLSPNLLTIEAGTPTSSGIPGRRGVVFDPESSSVIIDPSAIITLGRPGTNQLKPMLSEDGTRIIRARLHVASDKYKSLVMAEAACTEAIVRIRAAGLDFAFPPLAPGLEKCLWSGGDGEIKPFLKGVCYYQDVPSPDRLFSLKHGESMFAVDAKGAVIRIKCVQGRLVFFEVTVRDIVHFLSIRVPKEGKRAAYGWGLRTLNTLIEGGHKDAELFPLRSAFLEKKQELE